MLGIRLNIDEIENPQLKCQTQGVYGVHGEHYYDNK